MRVFLVSLLFCSLSMSVVSLLFFLLEPLTGRARAKYYAWLVIIVGFIIPIRPQLPGLPAITIINIDSFFSQTAVSPTPQPEPPQAGPPQRQPLIPETDKITEVLMQADTSLPRAILQPQPAQQDQTTQTPVTQTGYTLYSNDVSTAEKWSFHFPDSSIVESIAACVWLMGFAFAVCRQAIMHYRFIGAVRRWSEAFDEIPHILDNMKVELRIRGRVCVKRCPLAASPMMIGFLKPVILLPMTNYSEEELRFIL